MIRHISCKYTTISYYYIITIYNICFFLYYDPTYFLQIYYHLILLHNNFFSLFVMLQHFYDYPNRERDVTLWFFWYLFCLIFLNNLYFLLILDSSNLQRDEVTPTCHWLELICPILITHLNGVNILSFKKSDHF